MDKIISSLTILFEEPFWIGIYERQYNDIYEVSKITFGSEPKDYEVYDFIQINWKRLIFSPSLKTEKNSEKQINPKRMQKLIKKSIEQNGVPKKAWQAIKLMQEQNKIERKKTYREKKEINKERQYDLKQEKKKEKHRGH